MLARALGGLLVAGLALLALRGDPELPAVTVLRAGPDPARAVDVLFVGDGYTKNQLRRDYLVDLERYTTRLFEEEPFRSYGDSFTVRALMLESKDEGCDFSPTEDRRDTALESHLDKPDGRLLTFASKDRLAQLVSAVGDVDIVLVMVNTGIHGGAGTTLGGVEGYALHGGLMPAPTFSAQHADSFRFALHELGHTFGGLADEYADEALITTYPLVRYGADLAAPNLTLARRFNGSTFESLSETIKWRHFLLLPGACDERWVHEGGYYRTTGVFHPWRTCIMLEHESPFCPVCEEEMVKAIARCTGTEFDDAAYHAKRPLAAWQ